MPHVTIANMALELSNLMTISSKRAAEGPGKSLYCAVLEDVLFAMDKGAQPGWRGTKGQRCGDGHSESSLPAPLPEPRS